MHNNFLQTKIVTYAFVQFTDNNLIFFRQNTDNGRGKVRVGYRAPYYR